MGLVTNPRYRYPATRNFGSGPRQKSNVIRTYWVSPDNINNLLNDIGDQTLWEGVSETIFGKPGGQILGLYFIPNMAHHVATRGWKSRTKIRIGQKQLPTAEGREVPLEVINMRFGAAYLNSNRFFEGSWLDWECQFKAMVPMVGLVDLETSQVMREDMSVWQTDPKVWNTHKGGATVNIGCEMNVNITNGRASVSLTSGFHNIDWSDYGLSESGTTDTPYGGDVIFEQEIQWGYEIPLTATSQRSGALAAVREITRGAVGNSEPENFSAGSLTGEQSMTSTMHPYVLTIVPIPVLTLDEQRHLKGLPVGGKRIPVRECTGYLRIFDVVAETLESVPPIRHYDELIQIMREGIYI